VHSDNLHGHGAWTTSRARAHKFWLSLQILLDTPTQDNYIAVPDGSGIFVIEALEPLFIDTSGNVYLAQDLIVHVGQLVAGSIGRSFGKPSAPLLAWGPQAHAWVALAQACILHHQYDKPSWY